MKYPIDRCELVLPNYGLYISSLVNGRGVATYIHESLSSILVENLSTEPFEESVWCCCKLDNSDKLLIGNVYRSPNSSSENNKNLNVLLKSAMQASYSHVLITGDFNYKEIDWLTIESTVDIDNDASIFLENIRDLYLTQHVTQHTRFREDQNESCLDLIFTNAELMVDSLEYLPSLGASDHLVLLFNYVCYIPPESSGPPKFNFFKGDYVAMREALAVMDWNSSMDCSTDSTWENFVEKLNSIIEKHVPKRSHTYSYKKPWMNSETAKTIDKKRRAWIKLRNCPNASNISSYKNSRNEATSVIRSAKFEYEKDICSKVNNEPKLFWSYVKSKCKTRDKVCDLMKNDGTLTNSERDKAEVLNDFFCECFH